MKKVITGNSAVSYGVKCSDVQVIAAYPITPQTQVVEKLSEMCSKNEMKAKFINVESEHSAMAACIGASMTGARVFTATSSQGLAYMHELLHWASRGRLPIVMANVNRAMAPGWNIWADQTDSLSQRDTGWMQLYCKDNQEVLDSIIVSYKVCEKLSLPAMVNLDAFYLSHTAEPVDIPDIHLVRKFLPPYQPKYKVDVNMPKTFGTLTSPEVYTEFQYKIQKSMEEAFGTIEESYKEFYEIFGRKYSMIETYMSNDAEDLIISSSTMAETASLAVDSLRMKGEKVGSVRIRYLRPLDIKMLSQIIKGKKRLIILDRNISLGSEGIFCQEIKAALYNNKNHPPVYGYVLGLGGRDVDPGRIESIYYQAKKNETDPNELLWGDIKL